MTVNGLPSRRTSAVSSWSERANAGDVDGVAALYESDAVVASAGGDLVTGAEAIRGMHEALLADPPQFAGDVRPGAAPGRSRLDLDAVPWRRDRRDCATPERRHLAVGRRSAERHRIAIDYRSRLPRTPRSAGSSGIWRS